MINFVFKNSCLIIYPEKRIEKLGFLNNTLLQTKPEIEIDIPVHRFKSYYTFNHLCCFLLIILSFLQKMNIHLSIQNRSKFLKACIIFNSALDLFLLIDNANSNFIYILFPGILWKIPHLTQHEARMQTLRSPEVRLEVLNLSSRVDCLHLIITYSIFYR